jgi:hypothetical protein
MKATRRARLGRLEVQPQCGLSTTAKKVYLNLTSTVWQFEEYEQALLANHATLPENIRRLRRSIARLYRCSRLLQAKR